MRVVIDRTGDSFGWRLVWPMPSGADVLARGARTYADPQSCYRAAALLRRVPREAMLAIQQPDGHWRWVARGPDGRPLASSPAAFHDAASCGQALDRLLRHLGGADRRILR